MKTATLFSRMSTAATALAASFAIGLSMQASAEDAPDQANPAAITESLRVSYVQADLATAEGRAAVQARIRQAAEQVCGPTGYREAGSPALASHNRQCVAQATAEAMEQLADTQVATLSR